MTQEIEEILTGNKLIALFMGKSKWYDPMNFTYHNKWDDLMSVIQKIEETKHTNDWTYHVRIDTDYAYICKHSDYSGIYAQSNHFTHKGGKIYGTWGAVVQFIKRQIEDGVLAVTA